jgi:hypothetical protein
MVAALRLSILMTGKAYLPEAYAYSHYLGSRGWHVKLCPPDQPDYDCDVLITYQPERMPKRINLTCKIVHEYHSLSTGSYPKLRKLVRKLLSETPDGRIFLNRTIRQQCGFKDEVGYIERDMGVDDSFFERHYVPKEFDVVYCGSINGRPGLAQCINGLTEAGYSVLVIGEAGSGFSDYIKRPDMVQFIGRMARPDISKTVQRARFGLNYTTDIYPLNIQTSTKTLEYLSSGLGLISNRYAWSEGFAQAAKIPVVWLDDLLSGKAELSVEQEDVDMERYRWTSVLDQAGIEPFLRSLVDQST